MLDLDPLTLGEFLLAVFVTLAFFAMMYVRATRVNAGNKQSAYTKQHFIIVLGHYIGYFYRESHRNVLSELDALKQYLETVYSKEIAEKVAESLIFQQGRLADSNFRERYVKPLPHKLRLQILIILFKIAKHEDLTGRNAADLLRNISKALFISPAVFAKTKQTEFPDDKDTKPRSFAQTEHALIKARNLLGISGNASDRDVKKAYRRLAKQFHPDTNPNIPPERFLELKNAYDIVMQHRGFA
jgi:DnaJ-domain-containing protein 1